MDSRANRYIKTIAILAGLLAVVLAAFAVTVNLTQPGIGLEKTAEAQTLFPGLIIDKPFLNPVVDEAPIDSTPLIEPLENPTKRIYSDSCYLATYLAIGRYQYEKDLPELKTIYEELLAKLGIDFTTYKDLPSEIRAVKDSLEQHPDIWTQTADQLLATDIVPDKDSLPSSSDLLAETIEHPSNTTN